MTGLAGFPGRLSPAFSSPTASRISPSLMPAAARASGVMRECVVVAGCVIVVRVSPRFAVIDTILVLSITRHAFARCASGVSPFSSNDTTAPPAFCWRLAIWYCGCDSSPG